MTSSPMRWEQLVKFGSLMCFTQASCGKTLHCLLNCPTSPPISHITHAVPDDCYLTQKAVYLLSIYKLCGKKNKKHNKTKLTYPITVVVVLSWLSCIIVILPLVCHQTPAIHPCKQGLAVVYGRCCVSFAILSLSLSSAVLVST
jgi:hypothetical protein